MLPLCRHGEPHRDFSAIIGWKALSDSIAEFGESHEFTKLVVDLKDKDPDDAFSSVPYEKGFTFLYHLEKLLGREKWDKFIPHVQFFIFCQFTHLSDSLTTLTQIQYFQTFARKSLDSIQFKDTLINYFSSDSSASSALHSLDWDKWFYAPGFPPKPDFDTSLADVCYALASKWESRSTEQGQGFQPQSSDVTSWTANQVVVFLERVQEFKTALKPQDVRLMAAEYRFTGSKNVEILSRYFAVGLKAKDEQVYEPTAELLGKVGRMKFVRPL